jgi:hypothetical protein
MLSFIPSTQFLEQLILNLFQFSSLKPEKRNAFSTHFLYSVLVRDEPQEVKETFLRPQAIHKEKGYKTQSPT